jgi:hypothetical protein
MNSDCSILDQAAQELFPFSLWTVDPEDGRTTLHLNFGDYLLVLANAV